MVIDGIFAVVAVIGFGIGYQFGVFRIILSGFSVLLALVVAVQYTAETSVLLQDFFRMKSVLMPFIAFVFSFFVALLGIRLVGQLASGFFKSSDEVNKIAGGLLIGVIGLFLYSGVIWFLTVAEIINPETASDITNNPRASRTLPFINLFLNQFDVFMENIAIMFTELSSEIQQSMDAPNSSAPSDTTRLNPSNNLPIEFEVLDSL